MIGQGKRISSVALILKVKSIIELRGLKNDFGGYFEMFRMQAMRSELLILSNWKDGKVPLSNQGSEGGRDRNRLPGGLPTL